MPPPADVSGCLCWLWSPAAQLQARRPLLQPRPTLQLRMSCQTPPGVASGVPRSSLAEIPVSLRGRSEHLCLAGGWTFKKQLRSARRRSQRTRSATVSPASHLSHPLRYRVSLSGAVAQTAVSRCDFVLLWLSVSGRHPSYAQRSSAARPRHLQQPAQRLPLGALLEETPQTP